MNTRTLLALLLVASIGSISAMSFEEENSSEDSFLEFGNSFQQEAAQDEFQRPDEPRHGRPKNSRTERRYPNIFEDDQD